MNKLYAPQIDNTLPAGYNDMLIIPFEHHPTVSMSLNDRMCIKIKDCLNNEYVTTTAIISQKIENNQAYFQITHGTLAVGRYYKVFLAYYREEKEGYYSNAGILKYTSAPTTTVSMSQNFLATMTYTNTDTSELLYCVTFELLDSSGQISLQKSPELYVSHFDSGDTITYQFQHYIDITAPTSNYQVCAKYETINRCYGSKFANINYNYVYDNSKYVINVIENSTLDRQQYENAVNIVAIEDSQNSLDTTKIPCHFTLWRFDNNTQEGICLDSADSYNQLKRTYYDLAITQGSEYNYVLLYYKKDSETDILDNNTYYSYATMVYADFEGMYLYDNEYQLYLKYNPKINSFKTTIPQSKVEAYGAQFPIIFQNGIIKYKEFAINGLLSYTTDSYNYFGRNLPGQYTQLKEYLANSATNAQRTSTLSDVPALNTIQSNKSYNNMLERQFKLAVLNWLNNGKPKVFKSATEGNYIVQLLGVSMTPEDKTGRMLYNISANAVEVMEYNGKNLLQHNLILYKAQ